MGKNEYKDSKIDWFGQIPCDWNIKRIKYVIDKVGSGGTPESSNEEFYSDTGIPWVAIGDMSTTDYVYDTYKKITKLGLSDKQLNIYPKGTILYSIYATIGKVSELACDATVNQAILAFKENSKVIDKKYFKLFLQSIEDNVSSEGSTNTQTNLNLQKVLNFPIVLPELNEQKLIANYLENKLEKINKTIDISQRQIEALENRKKQIIEDIVSQGINKKRKYKNSECNWINKIPFEWKTNRLKYFFDFKKGLDITKEDLVDYGNKVISYGQIHSKSNPGTKLVEELYRYVDDTYLRYKESLVNKYDFVFADTSEDLEGCGNCAYIDRQDTIFAGYHTIIASPRTKNDMRYFAYLFKTDFWRKQIREKVWAVKLYSITQKILKDTEIMIPDTKEQKEIADYLDEKVDRIDKIISVKRDELDVLRKYKKSLIYEYVTGKKRV